jgi:hypothetical protein
VIEDAAQGRVRYDLMANDTASPATITGEWVVEFPGGGHMTVPNDGTFFTLLVSATV